MKVGWRNLASWAVIVPIVGPIVYVVALIAGQQSVDLPDAGYRTYVGEVEFRETEQGQALVLNSQVPIWMNCSRGALVFGCVPIDRIDEREALIVTWFEQSRDRDFETGLVRSLGRYGEGDIMSAEERRAQMKRMRQGLNLVLGIAVLVFSVFSLIIFRRGRSK